MRIMIGAIIVVIVQATAVLAWGPNGHRITAKIGQDNLSPAAQARLEQMIGMQSLSLIATWPDFVRSFPEYDCFKPWHFLTVEDGQSLEDAMRVRPTTSGTCDMDRFHKLNMPANVVEAIIYFAEILNGDTQKADDFAQMLRANGASPYNQSIDQTALALLVHFVGDVHQPLHVGRGPDRGGNTIMVQWFDEDVNLHEVWDELMIGREQLSYSEFSAFLEQVFAGDSALGRFEEGPMRWAQESVDVRAQVYDFGDQSDGKTPQLRYAYAAKNNMLLKQRLFAGGKRLSILLDALLLN